MKEKTSPNWLFGLGYLFVASIILLNYISQKTDLRSSNSSNEKQIMSSVEDQAEQDILQKQLKEERRINREMSEMINNLQTAIKYSGTGFHDSSGSGSDSTPLPSEFTFEEILQHGLPNLTQASLPSKGPPENTSSKRNPFLPFYQAPAEKSPVLKELVPTPVPQNIFKLKADPKIPLPLQNTWNVPVIFEGQTQNDFQ